MPTAPSISHQGAPVFTFSKEAKAQSTPQEGWRAIKNRGQKTKTPVGTLAKAKANALPPPGTRQAKGWSKEPDSYCPKVTEIKAREAKLRAFTVAVDREYQEKAAQQLQASKERAALKECASKANEQLARPTTPKKNKEKRKFDSTPQHMRPKRRSLEALKPAKARSVTSTGSTTSDVMNTSGSADWALAPLLNVNPGAPWWEIDGAVGISALLLSSTVRPSLPPQAMLQMPQIWTHRSSVQRRTGMRVLRRTPRDEELPTTTRKRFPTQVRRVPRRPYGLVKGLPFPQGGGQTRAGERHVSPILAGARSSRHRTKDYVGFEHSPYGV
ncbi:hypothetical protein N7G274_008370 [Stereocaulon virgatum]|uniref:TPX2 C-terminal domain-containing protein n=1 Tax=Stereocaulon virgatum TaxID=373712 RepID=A0ABR3ZZM8_9LECA